MSPDATIRACAAALVAALLIATTASQVIQESRKIDRGDEVVLTISDEQKTQYLSQNFASDAYKYGYQVSSHGQFHHEIRGPDGVTYGCYGYVDPLNRLKTTFYLSDGWGYRVVQVGQDVELFVRQHEYHAEEQDDHSGVVTPWRKLYFPSVCAQYASLQPPPFGVATSIESGSSVTAVTTLTQPQTPPVVGSNHGHSTETSSVPTRPGLTGTLVTPVGTAGIPHVPNTSATLLQPGTSGGIPNVPNTSATLLQPGISGGIPNVPNTSATLLQPGISGGIPNVPNTSATLLQPGTSGGIGIPDVPNISGSLLYPGQMGIPGMSSGTAGIPDFPNPSGTLLQPGTSGGTAAAAHVPNPSGSLLLPGQIGIPATSTGTAGIPTNVPSISGILLYPGQIGIPGTPGGTPTAPQLPNTSATLLHPGQIATSQGGYHETLKPESGTPSIPPPPPPHPGHLGTSASYPGIASGSVLPYPIGTGASGYPSTETSSPSVLPISPGQEEKPATAVYPGYPDSASNIPVPPYYPGHPIVPPYGKPGQIGHHQPEKPSVPHFGKPSHSHAGKPQRPTFPQIFGKPGNTPTGGVSTSTGNPGLPLYPGQQPGPVSVGATGTLQVTGTPSKPAKPILPPIYHPNIPALPLRPGHLGIHHKPHKPSIPSKPVKPGHSHPHYPGYPVYSDDPYGSEGPEGVGDHTEFNGPSGPWPTGSPGPDGPWPGDPPAYSTDSAFKQFLHTDNHNSLTRYDLLNKSVSSDTKDDGLWHSMKSNGVEKQQQQPWWRRPGFDAIGVHPPSGSVNVQAFALPIGPDPRMCPCYLVASNNSSENVPAEDASSATRVVGQLAFVPVIFTPYCPGDESNSDRMRSMFPSATPVPYACNACANQRDDKLGIKVLDLNQLANYEYLKATLSEAALGFLNIPLDSSRAEGKSM